jgi:UDP:flavonoid glycosyltransferase YjiC (YdhE family)
MFSTYSEGVEYLKRHNLPVATAPEISLANDESGGIDLKKTSITKGLTVTPTFLKQVETELKYMKDFKPDLVFSDSRLSSIFAAKLLGIPKILVLNQFHPILPRNSDEFRIFKLADSVILSLISQGWGMSDLILIPDFPEPYTISQDSLRIPKHYKRLIRFVGAILPKKPDDVLNHLDIKERLNVDYERELIYVGISGPRNERNPLINILETVLTGFPDKYKIVLSLGDPLGGSTPIYYNGLVKIPWIKDRFDYLKACDFVVSRAGHETIMQSICYNKPSILIPVPNHTEQYANARRSMELGVAEAIHQNELRKEVLINLIDYIGNNDHYVRCLNEMNKRNLGDGMKNSIDAISEFLPN